MVLKTVIHVISHKNCYDGLAAAWCAWREFGDRATYHYCNYHDPLPEIADGDEVYILDYSRDCREILSLLDRGCIVVLLDHHETALVEMLRLVTAVRDRPDFQLDPHASQRDLSQDFIVMSDEDIEDFIDQTNLKRLGFTLGKWTAPGLTININLNRSGAVLAWNFFQAPVNCPAMLNYIDDRDRWVWLLPFSEEISEALRQCLIKEFRPRRKQQQLYQHALALWESSEPDEQLAFIGFQHDDPTALLPHNLLLTCEAWVEGHTDPQKEAIAEFEYLSQLAADPDYRIHMAEKGKPLVEPRQAAVQETCKEAAWGNVFGYEVPVVQAEKHHSWVGHELCKAFPEAPFSVTWRNDSDGVIKVDLRSEKGGIRVNRIARQLGGGGHPTAAGFTLQQVKMLKVGDRFHFIRRFNPLHIEPSEPLPWETYTVTDGNTVRSNNEPDAISKAINSLLESLWTIKLKD